MNYACVGRSSSGQIDAYEPNCDMVDFENGSTVLSRYDQGVISLGQSTLRMGLSGKSKAWTFGISGGAQ